MSTQQSTAEPNYLQYQGKHDGLLGWLLSTDHKRIAILYLVSMLVFFFSGVSAGFVMRLVQLTPFHKLITAQTYNALFTFHGVVMIFLFVIPGLNAVFGNFILPLIHRGKGRCVSAPQPCVVVLFHRRCADCRDGTVHRQWPAGYGLELLRAL